MSTYTDYPITELGDTPYQLAPIRECQVTKAYPDCKYVTIVVGGVTTEIKRGYVYDSPGRCGEVSTANLPTIRLEQDDE